MLQSCALPTSAAAETDEQSQYFERKQNKTLVSAVDRLLRAYSVGEVY